MPSLHLRNPLRRDPNRPTLKQRAATLKATAARLIRKPKPLPAAGSPEAAEAFRIACQGVDAASRLSDADMEALCIVPGGSLWTSDRVQDALDGKFSRFLPREIEAARATSRTRLRELQILTLRRELRMAEAAQTYRIHEVFALAYGDEPDPVDEDEAPSASEPDPILALIEANRAAEATMDAQSKETPTTEAARAEIDAAETEQVRSWKAVYGTPPTTLAGLAALREWTMWQIERHREPLEGDGSVWADAYLSLYAALRLVLNPADDAELIALGHAFDAATIRHREACDALDTAENHAEARIPERPTMAGNPVTRESLTGLTQAANGFEDEEDRSIAHARLGELSAALAAWEAERDRVLGDESVTEARDRADEAGDAAAAIAQQATALPAHTLAGVWVKVRIAAFYGVADPTASPAEGYTGEAALRSLYRDAPRLVLDAETADIRIVPEA